MANPLETIRHSDILHRIVIDRATADELGRVDLVWMDPDAHRVLGLVCKSGLLAKKRWVFNLGQIQNFGSEGVVVNDQPVEANTEQVSVLESLIGKALWSDGGDDLGTVTDFIFHRSTGFITDYLFKSQGWRGFTGGLYRLPADQVVSFGAKRVLVTARATRKLVLYEEGLQQKISKVSDTLREDLGDRLKAGYAEATQELQVSKTRWGRSLSEQTQSFTQQAKGQIRQMAQQANQVAKTVGQQYEDGTLMEQIWDKFQGIDAPPPPPQSPIPSDRKKVQSRSHEVLDDEEPWI